jgi:predicted small integral membrane protein
MMVRYFKIALVLLVGLWALFGAMVNLSKPNPEVAAAVMSMAAVPGEHARAISHPALVWLAWGLIPLSKLAAAALCFAGGFRLWRRRHALGMEFDRAKSWAIAGCATAMVMLYGVFIVFMDGFFEGWRTPLGQQAAPSAFIYFGCIAFIALFVNMREHE